MQLFELFIKGGYVMYPLLACSFIVIVIFVERVRFYRSVFENVQELQELVNPLIAKHDWKAIISLKNTRSGMISHILAEAARGGDNIEKQERKTINDPI